MGPGDPGVKPGAFLSGPPPFLRSPREDHGLNGYGLGGNVWVAWVVWVLGLELPGLTGGSVALGSRAKGQGGDGAPPRGRRPTVVDGRTWVLVADGSRAEGCRNVENSSTGPGLLAPDPLTGFRAPDSYTRKVTRGNTSCRAAAHSPTGPLVSRGMASLLASGLASGGRCADGSVVTRRGCLGMEAIGSGGVAGVPGRWELREGEAQLHR